MWGEAFILFEDATKVALAGETAIGGDIDQWDTSVDLIGGIVDPQGLDILMWSAGKADFKHMGEMIFAQAD